MSEREVSLELRQRLAAALYAGARLRAPLPSQARYAIADGHRGSTVRARLLALAAVAALVLGLLAVVGPQQPRVWIEQKVTKAIQDVGIPLQPSRSSHKPGVAAASSKPIAAENPQAGPKDNAAHSDSRGPSESSDSPHGPVAGAPPAPEPTQGPEPGDGGGGRGGDHSAPPETPSPDNG
jgi:hypothetical protein